jgi:hypothetical protein
MVERQMVASIRMTANLWYSAWIDAGQPELRSLVDHAPSDEELKRRLEELQLWKNKTVKARTHEAEP